MDLVPRSSCFDFKFIGHRQIVTSCSSWPGILCIQAGPPTMFWLLKIYASTSLLHLPPLPVSDLSHTAGKETHSCHSKTFVCTFPSEPSDFCDDSRAESCRMLLRLNCTSCGPNQHNKSECHRRCVGCAVGGSRRCSQKTLT